MTPEERKELVCEIACAVKDATHPPLTEDEQRWVRMAIQREAQSIALRKAIIEKTLAGVLWSGIVWVGYVFLEYAKTHGFK